MREEVRIWGVKRKGLLPERQNASEAPGGVKEGIDAKKFDQRLQILG